MSFSIAWLDLREPADHAARDLNLLQRSVEWLRQANHATVVDLGSGTGSTLRAFGEAAKTFQWRLIDIDKTLLNEANRRHSDLSITIHPINLTEIELLPLKNAALVSASALFDLASRQFCDRLIKRLQTHNIGLYAALNYDGVTGWWPNHPADELILKSFNRDQLRDKGFGPALGPDAAYYLADRLHMSGFDVSIKPSPWHLGSAEQQLTEELVRGIASAVVGDPSLDAKTVEDWLNFRLDNAKDGSCIVGHLDLLALPR